MHEFFKFYLFIVIIIYSTFCFSQVGIGTVNPDASAILDIVSATQGVLLPRLTTAQRDGIVNPADGLLVFNLDSDCLNIYSSVGVWLEICASVPVIEGCSNTLWMELNLGAARVATYKADALAFGDLYQWGRGTDGHQVRTSGTTLTLSSTDTPGHGNFILTPNGYLNWRNPGNYNLWQGAVGINNPCPEGFRIPTRNELDCERLTWSTNNLNGAFASPLKWTAAGFRYPNDGNVLSAGAAGYYYSSTRQGFNLYYLGIYSTVANVTIAAPSNGLAVRCIKD